MCRNGDCPGATEQTEKSLYLLSRVLFFLFFFFLSFLLLQDSYYKKKKRGRAHLEAKGEGTLSSLHHTHTHVLSLSFSYYCVYLVKSFFFLNNTTKTVFDRQIKVDSKEDFLTRGNQLSMNPCCVFVFVKS